MRWLGQVGGRPVVVVLAGGDLATAVAVYHELDGLDRHLVVDGPVETLTVHATAEDLEVPGEAFVDHEGRVQQAWGVTPETGPVVAIVDRGVRVAAVTPATDVAVAVSATRDVVATLVSTPVDTPPPVLYVPEAIPPDMVDRVRAAWAAAAPTATGVETTADGRRVEALDHLRKRRRDHVVAESALLRDLTQQVGRRLIPEVHAAFAFEATAFEGFKVGAYDADDGGFFDAHRDNLSPSTSHRRFAVSINLDDDYDGGELVFPEYSDRPQRPGAREALVFSGSLLHEVRPVTRGRRMVLLSFLYRATGRR